ncbi:MAG: hypothetical protein IKT31_11385 [Firmicutes bacterium]|nr:hypothetical protein [Bacillota bacterium]
MKPLNFAILKLFTDGKEYCRKDVQDVLRADYGSFKAFKDHQMDEALMTAKSNGLIEESRLDMVDGKLVIYYRANQDGIDAINSYIK